MTPIIIGTLNTIAQILKQSPHQADQLVASIILVILGCYASGNWGGIRNIADTAADEAQAYVLMHSDE